MTLSTKVKPMSPPTPSSTRPRAGTTVFPILFAVSAAHLLNDTMQSTVTALFPVLRDELSLTYAQVGIIALMMNLTASLLQPVVGRMSDSRPMPRILPAGVAFTFVGIVALALAPDYAFILIAVTAIGVGSAIFHPESSRVAYLAAGPNRGLAQSLFQVGGNIGSATGPVMTAVLFAKVGQRGVLWLAIAATAAIVIQSRVARWYGDQLGQFTWKKTARKTEGREKEAGAAGTSASADPVVPDAAVDVATEAAQAPVGEGLAPVEREPAPVGEGLAPMEAARRVKNEVVWAMVILMVLVISKNVYTAGMTSYYTFYMIEVFGVTISHSQWFLFAFLLATALGTLIGGPLADRFGRRTLIWFSILGAAPFALLLPYASQAWSGILAATAGFIMASAFSIIVVYAQELLPGKIGLVSGLFFGLAFGIGGLGSAALGRLADATSITTVMIFISFLPLLGLLTVWLPKDARLRSANK